MVGTECLLTCQYGVVIGWHNSLETMGFIRCKKDVCVFIHKTSLFIISVHVDDLVLLTDDEKLRRKVIRGLGNFFKIKNLGQISRYVGLEVLHVKEGIKITQTHYIEKMQKRFLPIEFKPVLLPGPHKQKLTIEDCPRNEQEKQEVENLPFRSVIGSELYAALGSRPDVAYYVIATAKFCESFGNVHFNAALRILKYLVTTKSKGLFYPEGRKSTVKIYVDSDWAENVDDRKSIGGWACYFSDCLISWSSRRQNIVAKSSCEAEYIAAGDAVGEALWLQQLLSELRIEIEGKVTIYIDNKTHPGGGLIAPKESRFLQDGRTYGGLLQ
jgi:hypothetical protein